MYLLDTDHLTVFDRGGSPAQVLLAKMSQVDPDQIATTIISYEEQTRGWLSYIAKATSTDAQVLYCIEQICLFAFGSFDRLFQLIAKCHKSIK